LNFEWWEREMRGGEGKIQSHVQIIGMENEKG
jgi:hypothetical protein